MLFVLTCQNGCSLKRNNDEQSILNHEIKNIKITDIEHIFNDICNSCCEINYVRQIELVNKSNINQFNIIKKHELWNTDTFNMLFDNGARTDNDSFNNCILSKAIIRKNIELIKLLIDHGFDINYFNGSPLKQAIMSSFEIVKLLVDNGADAECVFSYSFQFGKIDTIKYLADYVINPDYNRGLIVACDYGNFDAVKYAISCGADINNDVLASAFSGYHMEIIKYLIDSGANIHYQNDMILDSITHYNYVDVNDIKYLLQKGIDVNARSGAELINAAKFGRNDVIELLIKHGSNIHVNDDAPVFTAISYYNFNTAKCLIKLGSNVNTNDDELLMKLCCLRPFSYLEEILEMIKLILNHGANINARNNYCLIQAIRCSPFVNDKCEHIRLIKFLIDAGANIHSRLNEMIRIASMNSCLKVIEFLKSFAH